MSPHIPSPSETTILLAPVGVVEAWILESLQHGLAEHLGTEVRLGEGLDLPREAYDLLRHQYEAEVILAALAPGDEQHVLGVVDADLYVPRLNFVFGLADAPGRRAVVALTRLHGDPGSGTSTMALFLDRALKEAVHELGHTYDLGHCPDRECVMAFSNSLAEVDAKGGEFCSRCGASLRRRAGRLA
jgi:archaemetzincin